MADRPILRLPNPRPVRRLPGSAGRPQRPTGDSRRQQQSDQFREEFDRIETALGSDQGGVELRSDPFGIAPERALVFVTAGPISNFVRAAGRVNLEVLSELELADDYELINDHISQNQGSANPTLYATMPTLDTLRELLSLWRRYEKVEKAPHGYTPWWDLFEMLAELRVWGPRDRLTAKNGLELENNLPFDDEEEVAIELEHWPTRREDLRNGWRQKTEARIQEMGGRIIDRSSIHESSFHYEGLLVGLAARHVRQMIQDPSGLGCITTLEGIQFVLPQTIAQALPSQSGLSEFNIPKLERLEVDSPFRAILFDGTPVAGHPDLDGGVVIEDVHDLVERSVVSNRRHATEMASLILRGDLSSDGQPLVDSRVLAIPLLIDEESASSPDDRLFIDLVYLALQRVFEGDSPLAPEAFVVNFSIGTHGSHFAGRMSSLARLLDWWSYKTGVLFVVSAGNVHDLLIKDTTLTDFENFPVLKRQSLVRAAQRLHRHERTLLSPSEALNVLTIGAASLDSDPSAADLSRGTIEIYPDGKVFPAISSGTGLGPFRCIKPDLIAIGGRHETKAFPMGDALKLRVSQNTNLSGLKVARAIDGNLTRSRTRGTSAATALVTRFLVNAAAALTREGGPYGGRELSRTELALLTRALAVNGAKWPNTAETFYDEERSRIGGRRHLRVSEEVARHFGYGFLNPELMCESPLNGVTLVGLGRIQKDHGTIFDMPLPTSLSGNKIDRSMQVTLAWFSPVEPTRAKYRLAALEAISADGSIQEDERDDKEWVIGMKSFPPNQRLVARGTVWSRRFIQKRKKVHPFSEDTTLPIRVQCRDASGGGLSPDEQIVFAIAVTLQLAVSVLNDIHEEIRDKLLVRV